MSSDDAGGSTCACGGGSFGGISQTIRTNGSMCTVSTTFGGNTSTSMGMVVSSCPDISRRLRARTELQIL